MVHCSRYVPKQVEPRAAAHTSPRFPPNPRHVEFMQEHPEYVVQNNAMAFLSDNGGIKYNLCHCASFLFPPRTQEWFLIVPIVVPAWLWKTVWSNFEIADMDFWRGEAYTAFFEYLDRHGGFYYEVLSPLPNTPTLN
jgi:hypothetical protein